MLRRLLLTALCAAAAYACFSADVAQAQDRAFHRSWGHTYNTHDWERFYHYPYVYYPQNYWGNEYYRSAESLYYRYPQEMRIPVYNRAWHNYYMQGIHPWRSGNSTLGKTHFGPSPTVGRYHWGHHFILDVF